MKYLKLINILPISFFIFALLALPAMAATHTMNGNIKTDWGVDLKQAYVEDALKQNDPISSWINPKSSWIPSSPDVDFVVENNIDPNYERDTAPQIYGINLFDWAGGKKGTHLQRTATSNGITKYDEGKIYCKSQNNQPYLQPAGGEAYDLEALYFDDDSSNMYFAIVTSLPPKGTSDGWKMGDIALDFTPNDGKTGDAAYEYGIKILDDTNINNGLKQGDIVSNALWNDPAPNEFPDNAPHTIKSGTVATKKATIVYKGDGLALNDKEYSSDNYVIEVSIPRSAVGSPNKDTTANLHIAIGCGNDIIELIPLKFKTSIPEFPSVVMPVAAILGIMLILGRRNKE